MQQMTVHILLKSEDFRGVIPFSQIRSWARSYMSTDNTDYGAAEFNAFKVPVSGKCISLFTVIDTCFKDSTIKEYNKVPELLGTGVLT